MMICSGQIKRISKRYQGLDTVMYFNWVVQFLSGAIIFHLIQKILSGFLGFPMASLNTEAGLLDSVQLICQPLALKTPDAGRQGFIDLPLVLNPKVVPVGIYI